MEEQFITCPNCNHKIELSEVVTSDLEKRVRQDVEKEHEHDLTDLRKQHENEKKQFEETLKTQATEKARKEVNIRLTDLEAQVEEKKGELDRLNEERLEFLKRQRKVEEKERTLNLQIEERVAEERTQIWKKAEEKSNENYRLQIGDKEKIISDLKKQLTEASRKAEQKSQQLQGEVLELQLEELLRTYFDSDEIVPVPKGVKGGDILQHIRDSSGLVQGTILWEAKRTKSWQNIWIQKLKDDVVETKADCGVIISETLPQEVKHIGQIDGIWIANFQSTIGLAIALREHLVEVAQVRLALVGKNEKTEQLYSYITGREFRQKIETVMRTFVDMQEDINTEKRAFEKIWAKRQKEIYRVTKNTSGMIGDIQGIIGAESVPDLEILKLPAGENQSSSLPPSKEETSEDDLPF